MAEPFLDFSLCGYGFYNGCRITQVEPGTEIRDSATGDFVVVRDGLSAALGREIYVTRADYEKLKAAISNDAEFAQAREDATRGHA